MGEVFNRKPLRRSSGRGGAPASCMLHRRTMCTGQRGLDMRVRRSQRTVEILPDLLRSVDVSRTVQIGLLGGEERDDAQQLGISST